MKKIFLSLLLCNISLLFAEPRAVDDLAMTGRSLANYQVCGAIAKVNGDDQLMFEYYEQMFDDTAAKIRFYPLNEAEIVFNAFYKGIGQLAKIEKESFMKLCSSRFDRLSRQMQKNKQKKNKLTTQSKQAE